jgi:putative transposase
MSEEKIGIDKGWYPIERLDNIIDGYNYWKKIIKRVYFIRYRYLGFSVSQSAEKVGISRKTGYNWQKIWNNSSSKTDNDLFKNSNFGGPKSKLSNDDLIILKNLSTDNMYAKDLKKSIKSEFDVNFSEKHVRTSIMQRMKKLKNEK